MRAADCGWRKLQRQTTMPDLRFFHRLVAALIAGAASTGAGAVAPQAGAALPAAPQTTASAPRVSAATKPRLDLTGRTRVGKASFYAKKFVGRKMADGTTMDPQRDNAASKTLPLGTTAKVTNLETGQSAVVTIRDRGPYVRGRIVDLTPSTAQKVGITRHAGVAQVEVAPIAVPLPDGGVKLGDAAQDTKTDERRE
jgi:rare lipoprotein A